MSSGGRLERLDKVLSNNGFGTRSEARRLVKSGAVACGGVVVRDFGIKIDAAGALIDVNGRALNYKKNIYLMMNKPKGAISASNDPRCMTVVDLLPDQFMQRKPFPVGRLDKDTTGLLLLTDDGDLAHRLLSPRKHVEKEYIAILDRIPGDDAVKSFENGIVLDGGVRLRPAKLLPYGGDDVAQSQATSPCTTGYEPNHKKTGAPAPKTHIQAQGPGSETHEPNLMYNSHGALGRTVRVVITEGKHHQVKRMFKACGITVTGLERVRMGDLALDPSLAPGEFRELTLAELELLK